MGRQSIGRTILVIEEQPYLWAVLQRRVEAATAYVRSATPGALSTVWQSCQPWPWLLVGTAASATACLPELVGSRPIAIHWLGQPPTGLPGRPLVHEDWLALAREVERLNALATHGLNGVRLMRNRGLQVSGGRVVLDAPHVEGLLAAPAGVTTPSSGHADHLEAAVQREVDLHRLPLRLERTGDTLLLA